MKYTDLPHYAIDVTRVDRKIPLPWDGRQPDYWFTYLGQFTLTVHLPTGRAATHLRSGEGHAVFYSSLAEALGTLGFRVAE